MAYIAAGGSPAPVGPDPDEPDLGPFDLDDEGLHLGGWWCDRCGVHNVDRWRCENCGGWPS